MSRRPTAWTTVLGQIRTLDDARALMSMFEYRDETLYANDSPIDDLTDVDVISERGVATVLAQHLTLLGQPTEYTDIYSPTRGHDPPPEAIESLIDRCRDAGVVLELRTGN